MGEWDAIRRLARERRAEVGASHSLKDLDSVLHTAIEQAGLWHVATGSRDASLAGAHALLDRASAGIIYNGDLSPQQRRFFLAHELGHWWLHDDLVERDTEESLDELTSDTLPYGQDYVSGYSPAQRREVEANVFAAEFLLPGLALHTAFLQGRTAAEIATASGLSEAIVLNQMAEALLRAGPSAESAEPSNETSKPPLASATTATGGLDDSQRAAAEVSSGPTLVIAGPGTGKTRTLVARALTLRERGESADSILALTFSNRAATEMRDRLAAASPDFQAFGNVFTFHGFGLELLRSYGTRIGLPPAPTLLDPVDAITLLEQNLARLNLREYEYLHNPTFPFRDILSALSRARDELVSPEEYAALAAEMLAAATDDKQRKEADRALEVANVYRLWPSLLRERGMLDFGDLIARAVELLQECPDVQAELQRRFRHLLVDEYQDVNRAGAVLIKLLAGDGAGLWAVGDLRQAIYQFRGASPANVALFEQDYPTGRRMSLEVNYRSREPIVRLFSAAAVRMQEGGDSAGWRADRVAGDDGVTWAVAKDASAQADGMTSFIRRFEAQGVPLSDQVVLCRTNAQAEALAEALERRGVPVLYLGDVFARSEIRDMLSLLSLAGGSGGALYRVAAFPEYAIPTEATLSLLERARETDQGILTTLGRSDPAEAGHEAWQTLHRHLESIAYRNDAFTALAHYLFGSADYLRRLLGEDTLENRQRRLALYQLLLLARGHAKRLRQQADPSTTLIASPSSDVRQPLRAFLAYVRNLLATGEDSRARLPVASEDLDAVRMMTVHAAKGLEFPVVFLPNLAKEMFPSRKPPVMVKLPHGLRASVPEAETASKEAEQSEEERLFFVALSRARDHLVLSRPLMVSGTPRDPSPLLGLLDGADIVRAEWTTVEEEAPPNSPTSKAPPELAGDSPSDAGERRPDSAKRRDGSGGANQPGGVYAQPSSAPPESPPLSELTLSELEQYRRCPRQYYYARVLKLATGEDDTAYGAFRKCVRSVTRWAQREGAAGRPVSHSEAAEQLAATWQSSGLPGHPQEPLLRSRADQIIERICERLADRSGPIRSESEMVAELPGGSVRIPIDLVEETAEGGLILEDHQTKRPADDDGLDPRYAVLRQAAKQIHGAERPVEIRIFYVGTGERRAVPEQRRWEPARVEKYDAALRGIGAGQFPTKPDSGTCARCPFLFLCPA